VESCCQCLLGFYLNTFTCERCLSLCSTCSSLLVRQSCLPNAELDATSMCKCRPGFYENSGGCLAQKGAVSAKTVFALSVQCGGPCIMRLVCRNVPVAGSRSFAPSNLLTLALLPGLWPIPTCTLSCPPVPPWCLRDLSFLFRLRVYTISPCPSLLNSTLHANFLSPELWTTEAGAVLVEANLTVTLYP